MAALALMLRGSLDDLVRSPILLLPIVVAFWLLASAAQRFGARLRRRLCLRLDARLTAPRHEVTELRSAFRDFADGYAALGLAADAHLCLWEAEVLLEEERFADARAVLVALDASVLTAAEDVLRHDQALVWALAHEGRFDAAAAIASRASLGDSAASADMHAAIGASLVLQRQYAAALVHLEIARAAGARPAASLFYLGVALIATGEQASAELARADLRVLAPRSRRARMLDDQARHEPSPYR
jgi:tetratricopeptide (TPR) repeat protein